MALVDAHIEMILRYTYLDQQCENTFMYFTEGAVFVGVNAPQVAEAWWNDIKTTFRAMVTDDVSVARISSVICRNLVSGGELGEFAIPPGEQAGTRTGLSGIEPAASYNAVGFRLSVGNTTTRPGQKRIPFMYENDLERNQVAFAFYTLVDAFASHIDGPLTLGAPVALGVLQPVVGGTIVGGFPTVYQDVIGHVTNPSLTTQVSRKKGRGR